MKIQQITVLMARISLFVIYFWFGLLKVIGLSPASPMVTALFDKTVAHIPVVSMVSVGLFIVLFGLFEMLIGILFIIPEKERLATVLFTLHIFTTALSLFVMIGSPGSPWTHILAPTLEGQYIIKNLALITCALTIWSSLSSSIKSAESNVTI